MANCCHKPGNVEAAQAQLAQMSGQRAMFYTAMTVIHVVDGTVATSTHDLDTTELQLRTLSHEQIAAYVAQDNPIDCAGSFKIESLGIILFSAVHSSGPKRTRRHFAGPINYTIAGFGCAARNYLDLLEGRPKRCHIVWDRRLKI